MDVPRHPHNGRYIRAGSPSQLRIGMEDSRSWFYKGECYGTALLAHIWLHIGACAKSTGLPTENRDSNSGEHLRLLWSRGLVEPNVRFRPSGRF